MWPPSSDAGSIPAASTNFEERNSLVLKGVALSCSAPTAWRYNLGFFGAQKFSYFLHYMRVATLIEAADIWAHKPHSMAGANSVLTDGLISHRQCACFDFTPGLNVRLNPE